VNEVKKKTSCPGNSKYIKEEYRGGCHVHRGKRKLKVGLMAGVLLVLAAFFFQSCVTGGGIGGTGITVQGIMTKGSIVVNGITFDTVGADIREDDDPATEDELQDGMKVILKGEINDDGVTGVVLVVEARDEVQGRVTNLDTGGNPPSFQILQQMVFTNDLTIFSDFPGSDPDDITDMVEDQFVEVHGLRDADGNIRATRVELLADELSSDPEDMELKGIVSNLSYPTFFIGLQEIDFSSATIEPAEATISEGDLVEVEGEDLIGNVLYATKVEREDLEDEEFAPDEGEEIEIEGFVTEFTVHPGDFKVDGVSVRTLSSTEFEHGSELNLMNGIEVEVEGYVSDEGILLVEEVEFKQARVEVNAMPTVVLSGSITLLDVDVLINDLTEIESGIEPLQTDQFYKIEGFQNSNGDIIAESIESGEDNRNILQGLVSSKDDVLETVTLLESTWVTEIQLSAGMDFEDDDETALPSLDAFLALVIPGETIVKVEDDGADGSWEEAELED
jgi:hypothetical protein